MCKETYTETLTTDSKQGQQSVATFLELIRGKLSVFVMPLPVFLILPDITHGVFPLYHFCYSLDCLDLIRAKTLNPPVLLGESLVTKCSPWAEDVGPMVSASPKPTREGCADLRTFSLYHVEGVGGVTSKFKSFPESQNATLLGNKMSVDEMS